MKELIAITATNFNDETIPTVNARDLHAFLEVQTSFKDWIARRISEYDFQEGRDFCSFLNESQGGRPSKEYALSLDMAKELCMVERNEKGKQARQYFIDCERQAKAKPHDFVEVLSDLSATCKLLLTNLKSVLALEAKVLTIHSKPQAFIKENEYEANRNRILNFIKRSGSKGVTLSDIIRGTKIPKRAREDILHDLIDGQMIQEQIMPTASKPIRLYKMAHYSLTRHLGKPENSLAI